MPKLSHLKVTIGLAGIRTLNKQLRDVKGKFRRNFGEIANLAKGLALGIASTIGAGLSAVITAGSELQTLRVGFRSIMGGAEEASRMVDKLNKFTAETPFRLEEVGKSARQLLAVGTTSDQVTSRLRMLGDIAAASGNSISDIAAAFAKVQAKGKVELENLNQLAERGIPIFDELRKVTGDANMEFGAGSVSVEQYNQALANMAAEGGFANDAMLNLSETVEGKMSTAMDNVQKALGQFAEKTGLLDAVTGVLEDFTYQVQLMSASTEDLQQSREDVYDLAVRFRDAHKGNAQAMRDEAKELERTVRMLVQAGVEGAGSHLKGVMQLIDRIDEAIAFGTLPEYTEQIEESTEATKETKKAKEELIAVEQSYIQTLGQVKELQSDTAVNTLAAAYSAHQLRGSYEVLTEEVRQVGNAHEHLSNTVQNATRALFDNIRDSSKGFHEYLKNMIADLLVRVAGLIAAFGILSLLTGGATGVATLMGPGTKAGLGHFLAGGLGITGFATGGMVTGPTLAMVGEGSGTTLSNPEVIAPLNKLQQMLGGQAITVSGMIRGTDILISNERSLLDRNRVRGF